MVKKRSIEIDWWSIIKIGWFVVVILAEGAGLYWRFLGLLLLGFILLVIWGVFYIVGQF